MNLIRVFIFGVFCLSFNTSLLNAAENKTVVETELWNLIADFGSMDDYKRYLSNYPNGYYAKKAKRKMAFILKQQGSSSRKIEPIKIIVQKTQKKIIKKKKIRKNGKAVLTINTSPSSAKIRILNI
ncbi:MAG: hypothetical protein HON94_02755, partial [Methylococcales bacterium]|nr:hypothetical protein [Methylococcales bacterium]